MVYPHLCLELIIKVWVIELHEAEEECSFVCDAVVLWDLLLHVFLQEGHVAQEATSEGSQKLKE